MKSKQLYSVKILKSGEMQFGNHPVRCGRNESQMTVLLFKWALTKKSIKFVVGG